MRINLKTAWSALIAICLVAAVAHAMEVKFSGEVVSVDANAHSFTLKGMENQKSVIKTFHAVPDTKILIGDERGVFAELRKGDQVTASYSTLEKRHVAGQVSIQNHTEHNKMFEGDIVAVDSQAHVFTVKGSSGEEKFYVEPGSRLYIGGEAKMLSQLAKGEHVTVTYESNNSKQMATQVVRRKQIS